MSYRHLPTSLCNGPSNAGVQGTAPGVKGRTQGLIAYHGLQRHSRVVPAVREVRGRPFWGGTGRAGQGCVVHHGRDGDAQAHLLGVNRKVTEVQEEGQPVSDRTKA